MQLSMAYRLVTCRLQLKTLTPNFMTRAYLKQFQRYEFLSSLQTDRQIDGQADRHKAMHMSPPCICTGVLN